MSKGFYRGLGEDGESSRVPSRGEVFGPQPSDRDDVHPGKVAETPRLSGFTGDQKQTPRGVTHAAPPFPSPRAHMRVGLGAQDFSPQVETFEERTGVHRR
jgi:hypothetical protein